MTNVPIINARVLAVDWTGSITAPLPLVMAIYPEKKNNTKNTQSKCFGVFHTNKKKREQDERHVNEAACCK